LALRARSAICTTWKKRKNFAQDSVRSVNFACGRPAVAGWPRRVALLYFTARRDRVTTGTTLYGDEKKTEGEIARGPTIVMIEEIGRE
jgi:hypothetical protein